MRAHRPVLVTIATLAVAACVTTPSASASTKAGHEPSQVSCSSPTATGSAPSRYDRTPKGAGPWHVPLDPCNTEGAGSSSTPYYNCAYWAAEKRPDVWANAVWKYGYSAAHPGAWRIPVDAKRAGYSVNHRPKVGDLAAWGRNVKMGTTAGGIYYTASPGGHVAYVESVLAHHRITVSSMGQGSTGGYTTTIAFTKHKTSFIHHLR